MSCGVDGRHGSDLAFLWLWLRPVDTAPIQPLAWEHPYAMSAVLKRQKKKKKKKREMLWLPSCALESLAQGKPATLLQGYQVSSMEKSLWGTEASCQYQCAWAILDARPPGTVKLLGDGVPAGNLAAPWWEALIQNHSAKLLPDSLPGGTVWDECLLV